MVLEGEGVVVALGEEEEEAMPQVKCYLCGTSHMTQSQLLYKRCFKTQRTSSCHEIEILGRGEGKEIIENKCVVAYRINERS